MKRLLKSALMPLQQLFRRLSERDDNNTYAISRYMQLIPNLKRMHSNGSTLGHDSNQYGRDEYAGFTFFPEIPTTALLESGKVVLIENIIDANNILIIARVIGLKESFYTYLMKQVTFKEVCYIRINVTFMKEEKCEQLLRTPF